MRNWVRIVCIGISFGVLLTSLLSVLGCTHSSVSVIGDNKEYSAYFAASLYPITECLDQNVEYDAVFSDEQAFLIYTEYPDGYWEAETDYFAMGEDATYGGYIDDYDNPIAPSYCLEVYSYSGQLAYTVSLDDYFSLSWERPAITLCEDGTILIVMTCANTSNLEVVYEYAYFDATGNLIGEVSQLQAQEYTMFLSSSCLSCSGTSGNIYLAGDREIEDDTREACVFVYSHEGTWIKTIPLNNSVLSLVTIGGLIYVASSSIDDEDMSIVLLAEIQSDLTLGTPYVIPQGELEYNTITGDASCVYLTNSQEVVSYSLDTQETEIITNFTDSDIQKDNIVSIAYLSDNRIAMLGFSPAVGNYDLIVLNGQDKDPTEATTQGTTQSNNNTTQPTTTTQTTESTKPAHVHTWTTETYYTTETQTVHHDAVTHVVHHDAVTHTVHHDGCYTCKSCGATFTSSEAAGAHCTNSMSCYTAGYSGSPGWDEEVVDTPAWDETVVDTPAWDETVEVQVPHTRSVCSECGATK